MAALTAVELLLLVLHPSGFWHNGGLDRGARIALVVLVWLAWTTSAWIFYWMFAAASAVRGQNSAKMGVRLAAWMLPASLVVFANLYVVSWLLFWRLGEFPDFDSLYFGTLNAEMLFRYLLQSEPTALLVLVTAIVMTTLAIPVAIIRIRRRLGHDAVGWRVDAVRGISVLLLAAMAGWLAIDYARFTADSEQRPQNWIEAGRNPWPPFSFELRFHTNPGMAFLVGLALDESPDVAGDLPTASLHPLVADENAAAPGAGETARPNVVLITVESLRSDVVLKSHQHQEIIPQINELARSGCFFPNCYSQSTHSDYADPAILSSLFPLRSVRQHFYHRSDPWPKTCIYDVLKPHGYATAIFSSQNEAWARMDQFYESKNLDTFFDSRSYSGPTYIESNYFRRWMAATQLAGKLDDAVTVQAAIDWIETVRPTGRPFFLSLNLQTSHFPYRLPDGETGPFQPSAPERETSFLGYGRENVPAMRNAYYNALNYLDAQVARLVDHLTDTGLRGVTIIAVTGDHGEAFYETEIGTHAGIPLETTTRVGLIVNSAGKVSPAVDGYLAQAIDIVPTLLGLAGVPPHKGFQGIDLLSPQRPPLDDRVVFIHCNNPRVSADAVLSGTGWKYLIDHRHESATLQFRPTDLEAHPNLLSKEPMVARSLDQLLTEWRRRQLLYYGRSRYYHWFYAPPAPALSGSTRRLLRSAASDYEGAGAAATAGPRAGNSTEQPYNRTVKPRSRTG